MLHWERFENRCLMSILVTTNADSGSGSLRQAITDANQATGMQTILFDIPSGPFTITLATPLPAIMNPVLLDGTSQPGYAGVPIIQIDGSTDSITGDGLDLASGSGGSRIRGLDIFGFADGAGIHIQSTGDAIQDNYLGTNATGSAAGPGNSDGVLIDNTASNTIGGLATVGNLISGNSIGILVQGSSATSNVVAGNLIGTTAAGTSGAGNRATEYSITGGASR